MDEIRKSRYEDYKAIRTIIEKSFGQREDYPEYCDGYEKGRYMLYLRNQVPIAMSGINREGSCYTGYMPEVDYTAVLPEYRGQGIMTCLFEKILKDMPDKLYYSAWRTSADYDRANAERLLRHFGFEEIKRPHVEFKIGTNCDYRSLQECVYYTGRNCHCYEDLWVLYHNKDKFNEEM